MRIKGEEIKTKRERIGKWKRRRKTRKRKEKEAGAGKAGKTQPMDPDGWGEGTKEPERAQTYKQAKNSQSHCTRWRRESVGGLNSRVSKQRMRVDEMEIAERKVRALK